MYNAPQPHVIWNQVPIGLQLVFEMLQQIKKITIPSRVIVCQVHLANMVPKIQTLKEQDKIEQKGEYNTWILDQLDLDEIERWSGDQQQAAKMFCVNILKHFQK